MAAEGVNLQLIRGMSDQIVRMLETSKYNIESILNELPGIVTIIRLDGTIFKGNQSLSEIFEQDLENLIYLNFLSIFSKESQNTFRQELSIIADKQNKSDRPESLNSEFELEIDHINPEHGIPTCFLWNVRAYEKRLPSGELLFLVLGKDVTALRKHALKLEDLISERTAKLQIKTNDINAMLHNMNQGIFTITRDLTIHSEYSRFLADIFKHNDIAGRNVMNFLFSDTKKGVDRLNKIRCILEACLGEDDLTFMFNQSDLPTEIVNYIQGEPRVLELAWNPIYDKQDNLDKILVNVRDITEFRKLQEASQEKEKALGIIHGILAVSMKNFELFIKNSRHMLDENDEIINGPEKIDHGAVELLFRNMHTIKGNARIFGYQGVADSAHKAEELYSKLSAQDNPEIDRQLLKKDLENVISEISFCEKVCDEQLKSVFKDTTDDLKEKIKSILIEFQDDEHINEHLLVQRIQNTITAENCSEIVDIIKSITNHSNEIAQRLNKEPPQIHLPRTNYSLPNELKDTLQNALVHCLNNALDHGIEEPSIRTKKGKDIKGNIEFSLRESKDYIELTIEDDGKGIDLNEMRKRLNQIPGQTTDITEEDLIEHIFDSGFSTAQVVTETSGRGIGLNAVHVSLKEYNGDIKVQAIGKENPDGFLPIRFVIYLPKVIKQDEEFKLAANQ